MKRIAYVLHRFPRVTDTFIAREIRSLQKRGTNIQVISIWEPRKNESTPDISEQWSKDTHFILPRSGVSIACALFMSAIHAPRRFLRVLYFALSTSRPGIRGLIYQLFYFIEAVLVAKALQKKVWIMSTITSVINAEL
jgi:colanic acid/amylovoran biosynthesis glycosyltransferase